MLKAMIKDLFLIHDALNNLNDYYNDKMKYVYGQIDPENVPGFIKGMIDRACIHSYEEDSDITQLVIDKVVRIAGTPDRIYLAVTSAPNYVHVEKCVGHFTMMAKDSQDKIDIYEPAYVIIIPQAIFFVNDVETISKHIGTMLREFLHFDPELSYEPSFELFRLQSKSIPNYDLSMILIIESIRSLLVCEWFSNQINMENSFHLDSTLKKYDEKLVGDISKTVCKVQDMNDLKEKIKNNELIRSFF